MSGATAWARAAALSVTLAAAGCGGGKPEVVTKAGGRELSAAVIDGDPLALLPSQALGIVSIDAPKLFASEFGQQFLAIVNQELPLPASANFSPQRDLEHVYVGLYSMTGVDAAAVAVGKFDAQAIAAAADSQAKGPLGQPIVKSSYAGRTLYTAANVGFSVLTEKTVLLGNETGIRRALDRIQEGHIGRSLPKWVETLLGQDAPVVIGVDFAGHPITDAMRTQLPFLQGAETVRAIANFAPPGVNVVGAITYPDAAAAEAGAASARTSYDTFRGVSAFTSLFGLGNPVQRLDLRTADKEVQVDAALDSAGTLSLLRLASRAAGGMAAPTTVKANESAPVGTPQ